MERTYVSFYVPDVHGARGCDQVVLKHPNGLCVVCLSPEHHVRGGGFGGRRASDASAETAGKRKRAGTMSPGRNAEAARRTPPRGGRADRFPAREARPDATSEITDDARGMAPTRN